MVPVVSVSIFYYSLDGGTNWITMRTYDFGVVWSGDRYVTTFEDGVGAMAASQSASSCWANNFNAVST